MNLNIKTSSIVFLLALFSLISHAQEKQTLDLSGNKWRFEGCLPGQGLENKFHKYMPQGSYEFAKVPGDVYTDLWRVGSLDDMNYAQNAQKAKWVMNYEWWYFLEFDLPKEMEGKQTHIKFDAVDFGCDVYLNGKLLGNHEGQSTPFTFNVSKEIVASTKRNPVKNNYLAVRIHPAPRSMGLVSGRKVKWKGDYGKNVTPIGIWQPVTLIATGETRIESIYAEPHLGEGTKATVDVDVEIINESGAKKEVEAIITLTGKNFKSSEYKASIKQSIKPGISVLKTTVEVPDAKLWFPWDLGEQNLYTASVVTKVGDEVQDVEKVTIGIREVKMEMNPGWTDDEVEYPWTVKINGKRHFVRSGTWGGPPDIFYGRNNSEETYRELIRLAKEANINNLRIFNWHPVEFPIFYELCSEAGISVWQDISYINNPVLKLGDEYLEEIYQTTIEHLKTQRNWPCNIIIEGSEETLFWSSFEQREYQLGVVNELEKRLQPYSNHHYIPTSPLSSHHATEMGFKHHESAHPHGVHYGVGQKFLEDYYREQNFAVIPELAVTSCPNVESIKKFIPEDELWPPGPSWGYHWADLDVLQARNYEVFGEDFTNKSIEEFVHATQVAQGVSFQYAFELYRTRKPKMSAINFCHFILNSPDFKWATVDYYLQPKESHYYIQRCFQPLLITLQHEKRHWMPGEAFKGKIWVVNDFMESYKGCKASLSIMDDFKKVVSRQTIEIGKVDGDSAKEFADVTFNVPGALGDKFYVDLVMVDETGKEVSKNEYFFLVANREKALETYQKYGKAYGERIGKYGYQTNRYFPGYWDNNKSLEVEWINVDEVETPTIKNETHGVVEDE